MKNGKLKLRRIEVKKRNLLYRTGEQTSIKRRCQQAYTVLANKFA